MLALLRPSAVFSKAVTACGDWGARFCDFDLPGFCIVIEGRCEMTPEGQRTLELRRGDFVFLTSASMLEIRSQRGIVCERYGRGVEPDRFGSLDGEPDFRMLAGSFRVNPDHNMILRDLLPALVHIPSSNADNGRLARLIGIIVEECTDQRPGYQDAMRRLIEACLILISRWLERSNEVPRTGLLSGLRHAQLAKAIGAMHGDIRHGWTVAELASLAGMSRSAFAARFKVALGVGPMEYMLNWRMLIAREALRGDKMTFDQVAESIGYLSASAFSTAFRRKFGISPSAQQKRFLEEVPVV